MAADKIYISLFCIFVFISLHAMNPNVHSTVRRRNSKKEKYDEHVGQPNYRDAGYDERERTNISCCFLLLAVGVTHLVKQIQESAILFYPENGSNHN